MVKESLGKQKDNVNAACYNCFATRLKSRIGKNIIGSMGSGAAQVITGRSLSNYLHMLE